MCDTVTVLDGGRIIAEGIPEDIRRNPLVIEAYLGKGSEPPPVAAERPGTLEPVAA